MIKILVLQRESHVAKGVLSLSVVARVTEALDYLQDLNKIEYIVISENDTIANNAVLWCDVILLSKHSSTNALHLVKYAKKNGVMIIYDIDDWIFSFPKYSAAKEQGQKLSIIKEIISLSDYVTVANKVLLNAIKEYCENPIYVPNGMYVEKYISPKRVKVSCEITPPRIVLTNADLLKVNNSKDDFLNALQTFFHKNPEYILDFYGDPFPEMFTMPFLHFTNRIPYTDYMQALINGCYQFAITPLGGEEDKESLFFNSCKNPFKYLNYATACVPGIYSNSSIYNDGTILSSTGILVENTYDDWLEALIKMSSNFELREKIRINAHKDILHNHHISTGADIFMNLFKEKQC